MSYKTQEAAERAAQATLKKLTIGDWRVDVFENLGWHCSLHWGYLNLSIYNQQIGSKYTLLIGHHGTGLGALDVSHGDDPNELVQNAVQPAIEALKYYTDVADWLKNVNNFIEK